MNLIYSVNTLSKNERKDIDGAMTSLSSGKIKGKLKSGLIYTV